MNRFLEKLRNNELALGQMVLDLFSPGIGPMLAACDLDFVIYDMEHGRCDIGLAAEMLASCRGTGITPMVRDARSDGADCGGTQVSAGRQTRRRDGAGARSVPARRRGLSFADE